MSTLALLLTFAFGSPHAAFRARIADALAWLCPCAPSDAPCFTAHARVARAVAIVASEAPDPEHAAALLIGLCAHEGRCVAERQTHGPARTFWMLEVPRAQRAALEADDVAAARLALRRARGCGGSLVGYAWGRCEGPDAAHEASAAGLRACERAATFAMNRAR